MAGLPAASPPRSRDGRSLSRSRHAPARRCRRRSERPSADEFADCRGTKRGRMVTKRVCILTYGCQMNVYDSARMAELLAPLGYQRTAAPDDAELVILNTCHIREKAAEKVYSELGKLRPLQARKARRGGAMLIAVGGCMAQAEGTEVLRRAPFVDLVF